VKTILQTLTLDTNSVLLLLYYHYYFIIFHYYCSIMAFKQPLRLPSLLQDLERHPVACSRRRPAEAASDGRLARNGAKCY